MKRMILALASGLLFVAPVFADETGGGSTISQSVTTHSVAVEETRCSILEWLFGACEE